MIISRAAEYGLIAAGYIALHLKDGNIMSHTISQDYNIPPEFFLKILQCLCKTGILQSKRGPRGGFVLGRDPSEITLLQIIEAIDGPASNYSVAEQTKNAPFALRMTKTCDEATAEQNRILSEATLADMIGSEKK